MTTEERAKKLLNRTTPMAMAIATNSLRIDEAKTVETDDAYQIVQALKRILKRIEILETLLGVTYTEHDRKTELCIAELER